LILFPESEAYRFLRIERRRSHKEIIEKPDVITDSITAWNNQRGFMLD
jgi:hypothetical protein